jgi:hypothetical protein
VRFFIELLKISSIPTGRDVMVRDRPKAFFTGLSGLEGGHARCTTRSIRLLESTDCKSPRCVSRPDNARVTHFGVSRGFIFCCPDSVHFLDHFENLFQTYVG